MPRVDSRTGKTGRGKRNPKTAQRITTKWVESGGLERALNKVQSSTITTTLPNYPNQFLRHRGREQVANTLARVFPNLTLDQLKLEPKEGRLEYPTPPWDKLDPLHPPYLAIRFHDILKLPAQWALLAAWNAFNSLDVNYPKPEPQRSKASPALHLGVWETYLLLPAITAESREQGTDVIVAMDRFLSLVGQLIAPRLRNLLRRDFPQQYSRQER
ncbi:hypothetical protein M413DRAFT_76297 [Hebeloma cylindrosporum]|uniref:Uncharacterized protein n=1 Tax=Hebeloma cylindrosporum TaxID=76867 RepID=A0A0C2YB13_HEBCY|nr:hypothetical protein M413DRAFT_76297 [Hebeloma cylindrosporum h7]